MPGKIVLEVTEGPIRGKSFIFEEHDTFIFGRARDCHARLSQEDTTASRHHFLLEVNPPDVRIRDLGSLNGTYVNGRKFGGRREGESPHEASLRKHPDLDLSDRDTIGVGETVFIVKIHAPSFCCRCHKEIPDEFQHMCRWIEDTLICPQCRNDLEKGGSTADLLDVCCEECGKDVSYEMGPGRSADYICESCRTGSKFNPVGLLVNLLLHEREESQEEATLTNVAGYRIERMLGRGRLGATYLARRKSDATNVVLKIMLAKVPVDDKARRTFHRDVEALADLRHSNIVELFEHGSAGSGFYFVMDYCSGGSVVDWMNRNGGSLTLEEAAWSVLQVLEGLSCAHQRGYVHRAIRPSNILLTGIDPFRAKLADFGLSRSFEKAGFSGMTATNLTTDSAMFLPREQLTQFRFSSPVSDVWSLAATFFYMITGRSPRFFPPQKDPLEIILRGELIPIREYAPGIPKKVAKVIDRALSDSLSERYSDASQFLHALNKAL